MMRRAVAILSASCALLAQQPEDPPLLRATSTNAALLRDLHRLLTEPTAEASLTGDGEREPLELRIGADGVAVLAPSDAKAAPGAPLLRLDLRPAAWMRAQRDAVTAEVDSLAPRVDLLLRPLGFPRGAGASLVADLVSQVAAIEQMTITVRDYGQDGVDVQVGARAIADTALAGWIARLSGATPRSPLAAPPDAAVRLDVALPAEHLAAICAPFVDPLVRLQANPAEWHAARGDAVASIACMDGTMSWVLDGEGMRMAFGMRDPAGYAAIARSTRNQEQVAAQLRRQRIDYEVALDELAHRGVTAMRTRMTADQPTAGLSDADGVTTGFAGAVGQAWLVVLGGRAPRERMVDLIDGVLDGGMFGPSEAAATSAPFLTLTAHLEEVQALLPEPLRRGAGLQNTALRRVDVTVAARGTDLELRAALQ